ncbi:hypothetical protein [Nocardia carnea]|uniref:hypothetical protein n=1 Tax=Nocardia carnea TaxID=37328 RepID=UPI0003065799|nr:hypothetical protein [Nocardia carnea]
MREDFFELTVPASVWNLQEMRHALSQRDVATVLSLVKTHHVPRLTQSRLALELGIDPAILSLIVNRKRAVTALTVLERIAACLRMPDPARMALGLAPINLGPELTVTSDVWRHGGPVIGSAHFKEATIMAAAESESYHFIQRTEASNVGPQTIDQLYGSVRNIVTRYPSRQVAPSFLDASLLRGEVFTLLKGQQHLGFRRDLYVFAAALSGVLANAAFDLGYFPVAETHARSALAAADEAGHNGLRTWVKGTQALIAYWDGRYRDAAQAAAAGWAVVPESGTARVRAAAIEARARARMGDPRGAEEALRRAEQAREAITDPDEIGGMMEFPMAKQLLYGGAARLMLEGRSNLVEAENLSSEAVGLYMQVPAADRRMGEMSLALLDLAEIGLIQQNLEAAAQHIDDVLAVGAGRRTESVSRRLFELHAALDRPTFRGVLAAISLRDRISDASVHALPPLPASEDEK